MQKTVSVVMTVRNDAIGCAVTLKSLAKQTHAPDEIVVVDGGSTDVTPDVIRGFQKLNPRVKFLEAAGANIAQGRNIGTEASESNHIATIDAGCRAEPDWLANLMHHFEEDPECEFVAGFYHIEPQSLLERVVGLATMRGQLDPVHPDTFNPSARSLAYTKALWARAGGWPDWIRFSEDTLFDHKVRQLGARWRFAGDAIVHWRPRSSMRLIAKQFYNYGVGRGHTQIGAPDFAYNLRNMGIVAASAVVASFVPWVWAVVASLMLYFYVWTFHRLSLRVQRRTQRPLAYAICLAVMWTMLASNTVGYLVGTWQRWRNQSKYRQRIDAYMATA